MHNIFKLGNHFLCGISFMYIEPAKTHTLLITFMLLHLTIDVMDYGLRIGFSIGDGEIFFKIQAGMQVRSY